MIIDYTDKMPAICGANPQTDRALYLEAMQKVAQIFNIPIIVATQMQSGIRAYRPPMDDETAKEVAKEVAKEIERLTANEPTKATD